MKASFVAVCATAAVVAASLAQPRTAGPLHPESLARVEAIASYCANVDPASKPAFGAKLAELKRGHSDLEIQRDRVSGKYIKAKAQADQTLARASTGTAVNGCEELLAEK